MNTITLELDDTLFDNKLQRQTLIYQAQATNTINQTTTSKQHSIPINRITIESKRNNNKNDTQIQRHCYSEKTEFVIYFRHINCSDR